MGDDLAAANVNRTYALAATSIAIFTFMLIFLHPRVATGEADGALFQATLLVMGLATFAFVLASLHYSCASVGAGMDERARARDARRADRFWLLGYSLLFLAPSMVLVSVRLLVVGAVWFVLWVAYAVVAARCFPRVRAR